MNLRLPHRTASSRPTDGFLDSLAALPILRGCPRQDIATVGRHTTLVRVAAGATLCSEGAPGREAFIIAEGEADVTIDGVRIARLAAGSVVGEMALLENAPRSATVTATTPMKVLAMSLRDFASIVDGAPTVSRRLLVTLAGRLRDADARASSAG